MICRLLFTFPPELSCNTQSKYFGFFLLQETYIFASHPCFNAKSLKVFNVRIRMSNHESFPLQKTRSSVVDLVPFQLSEFRTLLAERLLGVRINPHISKCMAKSRTAQADPEMRLHVNL